MKLSQKYIDKAENAILSNLFTEDDIFTKTSAISIKDYELLKEIWPIIQNDEINSYYQFGENAFGMTSYGLYKANNGKIYIIEAFLNEIKQVYNTKFMKDILHDNFECIENN